MVTGIEAAGLALAILPLFVNQIDAYVRGLEKIKGMRRYKREYKGYSVGLRTQYAILLNTLEQVLEGVVKDEDVISELIRDTRGDGWKDTDLQRLLRLKLGRDYDVYMDNIIGLSELLERLSHKLETSLHDVKSPAAELLNFWKLYKVLNRAVYDDLLAKISEINTALKTLTDQSDYREDTRKKRQTWHYLLKRYQKGRKHARELFQAMIGGNYWHCQCKEHHCVHLQLQTDPLVEIRDESHDCVIDPESQFRMVFSNTNEADPTGLWAWTEVVFEPLNMEHNLMNVAGLSLNEVHSKSHPKRKPRVQFNIPPVEEKVRLSKAITEAPSPIKDFCTSLCVVGSQNLQRECIGAISIGLDASVKYTMHAIKTLPKPIPQRPLSEALSNISRQDRLQIATGLACAVIQFYDNWLRAWWDSSDIYLAPAAGDGGHMLPPVHNVYLSWSLTTLGALQELAPKNFNKSICGDNHLLPLGLALVELSLGKSLHELNDPDDGNPEMPVIKRETASKLVHRVQRESGTNYANAVKTCLSLSTYCLDKQFDDRVFETVVTPLLQDLANF